MNTNKMRIFASLSWYEACITFLFTFTAKTSELLLAAGLIVSTANFLTDGNVMGANVGLAYAWAWAQALAIDSSLGITFYYIFHNIKQRDWTKAALYSLLTLLLAIVAGTITNVDTFSHALHTSISSAMMQVGLDVKILTTLRAVAVVGFVMMSRLKDVSFRELYQRNAPASSQQVSQEKGITEASIAQGSGANEVTQVLLAHLTPEVIAQIAHLLAQKGETVVTEEHDRVETENSSLSLPSPAEGASNEQNAVPVAPCEAAEQREEPQEVRLACAYQEMLEAGERISGRALAKRAHVHRVTCNVWLRERRPDGGENGLN